MDLSALFLVVAVVFFVLVAASVATSLTWLMPAGLAAFAAAFLVGRFIHRT
jgi:hypothetical protein